MQHATTARPRLMTAHEAADLLNVRPHRLYELVRGDQIPHIRLGCRQLRFDPAALEAWLRNGGSEAGA